ncbi:MAG: GTP cyclohydrolase I [Microbacterium sp.]
MVVDRERVAALTRELLIAIGDDPDRPGLAQTPQRVADTAADFYGGIGQDAASVLANTVDAGATTGPVVLRDVRFRSVCEHHLLPFTGRAHLAYLPGEKVVGLGALPRLVELLASRPQVQERLGEQIADALFDALDARGVLVVLDAVHQCVTTRGERQPDASTLTVAARGTLAEPSARAELIPLIGVGS